MSVTFIVYKITKCKVILRWFACLYVSTKWYMYVCICMNVYISIVIWLLKWVTSNRYWMFSSSEPAKMEIITQKVVLWQATC